ncbi:aldose epimerase family protein [Asticcacaulis sp. EMRT-3]|uniref:aldose epimerase family protein n=1 Tax=Asticcacaulis sp. EMRT-3 TaxID=3040349 RepID=UPI0024AEF153|nr:aldose epimerase family protein [Asticcacaulis sp. EMRT-3]MDI7776403.1 aldose epimerase family protein [Asticcacaulis sp. EMRT-3]
MKRAFALLPLICLAVAAHSHAACRVTHSPYGTMSDGRSVALWRVDDGQIAAGVLTLGGILHDLDVPDAAQSQHGHSVNVVRNLDHLAAYEKRDNFSSLIGRYANRIGGGGVTLDGRFYPLPGNAKGVITHGGAKSFGSRLWQARVLKPGEGCGIELSLVSPDGDNGFPGALGVTVRYRLQGKALRLDYQARTTKTTVVNLTDHAYFNLAGEGDVYGQTLEIKASHYLPLDHLHLPTGEIAPVEGTAYDLRKAQPLAGFKKLDDTFVLDGKGLKTAAILHDPKSGRTLTVSTTQPGLVVYTAGSFDGSLTDASGQPIVAGAGVALETQGFPDAPNHANFPTTVLHPGETYQATTVYRFR